MNSEDSKWSIQKYLAVASTFIIILLPTIGINHSSGKGHPILETTFMWPWLILQRFQPDETEFLADMYNYVLPPWTLIVFIPFLIGFRYIYKQFQHQEQKEKLALLIALIALIQMALIWLTYQSQEANVTEEVTMYYIPEILIILLQGGFGAKWYYETAQNTLKTPAKQTEQKKEIITKKQH